MLYLFGAKKMQTSAKKACFQFAKCSFSSAKKMQTSAKKTCFQFAECSFSSAKLRLFLVTSKFLGENIARVVKKKIGDSGMESRLLNIVVSMMKQRIIYSLLISSICFIISSLVFCIFRYIHHAATTPMKAPVPPP